MDLRKQELIKNLALTSGLRQEDVRLVLNALVEEVTESLKDGEPVTITGLGKFYTTRFKARTQLAPNGEQVNIAERNAPRFKSSRKLREEVGNA